MGWFDSLHDFLERDGFGCCSILPEEKYEEAEIILNEKLGRNNIKEILKEFRGIENLVYEDLCLSRFPHKDIPESSDRLNYLKLINQIENDSDTPFDYFVPDSSFEYFLGSTFKQFCDFAFEVSKCEKKALLNDLRDYENIVHPLLDSLLFTYGVSVPINESDLGGLSINSKEILYLKNSSPKEFFREINKKLKTLPENSQAYFSFIPDGEYLNWKEAIQSAKFSYDTFD